MSEITLHYPIINEIHAKRFFCEEPTFTQLIIKWTVFYRTWRQTGSFDMGQNYGMDAAYSLLRYGVQLLNKQSRTTKKFGQSTRGLASFL